MVFISGKPGDDVLVVREAPLIAVPIIAAVAFLFFWLSFLSDRAGNFWETWIAFSFGIIATALAAAAAQVRTCVFDRVDGELSIRDAGLFRRRRTASHGFGPDAHAELVITHDADVGDTYQAVLVPRSDGEPAAIELDDRSSFMTPSARIVMAFNA